MARDAHNVDGEILHETDECNLDLVQDAAAGAHQPHSSQCMERCQQCKSTSGSTRMFEGKPRESSPYLQRCAKKYSTSPCRGNELRRTWSGLHRTRECAPACLGQAETVGCEDTERAATCMAACGWRRCMHAVGCVKFIHCCTWGRGALDADSAAWEHE